MRISAGPGFRDFVNSGNTESRVHRSLGRRMARHRARPARGDTVRKTGYSREPAVSSFPRTVTSHPPAQAAVNTAFRIPRIHGITKSGPAEILTKHGSFHANRRFEPSSRQLLAAPPRARAKPAQTANSGLQPP